MFPCLNKRAPSYLTNMFSFYHPARSSRPSPPVLCAESSGRLVVPRSRTKKVWWPSFLCLRTSNLECATSKHSFIQFTIPIQIPPQNPLFSLGIWISQSSVYMLSSRLWSNRWKRRVINNIHYYYYYYYEWRLHGNKEGKLLRLVIIISLLRIINFWRWSLFFMELALFWRPRARFGVDRNSIGWV